MSDSENTEPLPFTDDWARIYMQRKFWGLVSAGLIVVLASVVWLIQAGWQAAGRQGWVGQRRSISVDIQGKWMGGEVRDCASNGKGGFLNCPEPGKGNYDSLASRLPERQIDVTFWGNISRDTTKTSLWHCKRESDSIICHPVHNGT
jgi:hypothetical protein